MTRVEVEEPKTVVEEVERFKCDNCGAVVKEDEITTVAHKMGDVPGTSRITFSSADQIDHLCENCSGLRTALKIREKKEYFRTWWDNTKRKHLMISVFSIPGILIGAVIGRWSYVAHNTADKAFWPIDIFVASGAALTLAAFTGIATAFLMVVINDEFF